MEGIYTDTRFVFLITYSFDTDYVAVPCQTEGQAIHLMHQYLSKEKELIKREQDYTPIVIDVSETEKIFVYTDDMNYDDALYHDLKDYLYHDHAIYKVIETCHNYIQKK